MNTAGVPFHADERAAQTLSGWGASAGAAAMRSSMPDPHRAFFQELSYVVAAVPDERGWPVATLLAGQSGFITSPDATTLVVAAAPDAEDPAAAGFAAGGEIALLGIDLATRRRNRANGAIEARDARHTVVRVRQSFGNCPKYIQRRTPERVARTPGRVERFTGLDGQSRALIARSDTFFVASRSRASIRDGAGLDVSHRGGLAGFVSIEADGSLAIPDYRGNHYFNTLGNLLGDARASLLWVDFDSGDLLQLQGEVAIDWSGDAAAAERTWRFTARRGWRQPAAVPLRWTLTDWSPATLATAAG